jgi:hypothetical protein
MNIILPLLPVFSANYVPINGKKTADIIKSAICIPQHQEIGNFLNDILRWSGHFFKELSFFSVCMLKTIFLFF